MEDNYNKANQVIFRYCSALIGKKKKQVQTTVTAI